MDGLQWKTLLKWMIWGYHYFRKHPFEKIKNVLGNMSTEYFDSLNNLLLDKIRLFSLDEKNKKPFVNSGIFTSLLTATTGCLNSTTIHALTDHHFPWTSIFREYLGIPGGEETPHLTLKQPDVNCWKHHPP